MLNRVLQSALAILVLAAMAAAQHDWQSSGRAAVERKDFESARKLVASRLAADSGDLEARAWHGRLLAWSGNAAEAESEYRIVLEKAPTDIEVMSALADVLFWQDKLSEALTVLDRAHALAPVDSEVILRRARVLSGLGRTDEARAAYRDVLRWKPNNPEAAAGIARLRPEAKHELRVGSDTDAFNYTDAATAQSIALASHWDARWTTTVTSTFYQRFGATAQRINAGVSRRFGDSWIGVSGGGAHDESVVPKREAAFEIGRAFRLSNRLVRGLESSYSQHWSWFTGSKVLVLSGTGLFYLPHDSTLTLTASGARSSFHLPEIEWKPSGNVRFAFPIHRNLRGMVGFAAGTEDYATVDSLGHFSARTFAGGLRYQLSRTQDIGGWTAYQDRSQGRTQTSSGITYGIHF